MQINDILKFRLILFLFFFDIIYFYIFQSYIAYNFIM